MKEVNWIKLSYPEYFVPPKDMVYILPCGEDNKCTIVCGDDMCVLEGIGVQECCDKLKRFDDGWLNIKEAIQVIMMEKDYEH